LLATYHFTAEDRGGVPVVLLATELDDLAAAWTFARSLLDRHPSAHCVVIRCDGVRVATHLRMAPELEALLGRGPRGADAGGLGPSHGSADSDCRDTG